MNSTCSNLTLKYSSHHRRCSPHKKWVPQCGFLCNTLFYNWVNFVKNTLSLPGNSLNSTLLTFIEERTANVWSVHLKMGRTYGMSIEWQNTCSDAWIIPSSSSTYRFRSSRRYRKKNTEIKHTNLFGLVNSFTALLSICFHLLPWKIQILVIKRINCII